MFRFGNTAIHCRLHNCIRTPPFQHYIRLHTQFNSLKQNDLHGYIQTNGVRTNTHSIHKRDCSIVLHFIRAFKLQTHISAGTCNNISCQHSVPSIDTHKNYYKSKVKQTILKCVAFHIVL